MRELPDTKPRTRAATAPADTVMIKVSRVKRTGAAYNCIRIRGTKTIRYGAYN